MTRPIPRPTLTPVATDLAEILRQSLAGLAPSDPIAHWLDRLEGRR